MSEGLTPIERRTFQAQSLMEDHPPVWFHPNKQAVFDIACPPGSVHGGELTYSRWPPFPLPESVDLGAALALLADMPGFYDYEPWPEAAVGWHVNFADPRLFVAYSGGLFAQDEMQVTEHPALGALKEALTAEGLRAVTVEDAAPTPVLVAGVERRCSVATDANAMQGRPHGLYGNAFARADLETVRRATTRVDPPTLTNLIAMAAPRPSYGSYTAEQIRGVLDTASTGFRAAALESAGPVVVHTGFWGCGAFGGNRELMTTLQAVAAQMAGLERLVVHTGDPSGAWSVAAARDVLEGVGGALPVQDLIAQLVSMGFRWGVSDGN